MDAVRLLERPKAPIDWDYDSEADVLYISFGVPKSATGVDVGDGVILRFDEAAREVVGLTVIGIARRLEEHLKAIA